MNPLPDIASRADIARLLEQFYSKAIPDHVIGYFFTDVAKLDMAHHLPLITDFWEMVLFGGNQYRKNAIAIHLELNRKSAMEEKHFQRWLQLFSETVDEMYEGPVATMAKQRALSIATVMRIKIKQASI